MSDGASTCFCCLPAARLREQYTYDTFGNPVFLGAGPDGVSGNADDVEIEASDFGHPYAYTGREWDVESGLYYYRSRYYDPNSGRFLQHDPLGFYDSMNLYSYVVNNPTGYIDPLGWGSLKKRPLAASAFEDTLTDPLNHVQFFFDSPVSFGPYENITDLGWFNDSKIRPDTNADVELKSKYVTVVDDLDDQILLKSIYEVHDEWTHYGFGPKWRPWDWRNCQDFGRDVLDKYREIEEILNQ